MGLERELRGLRALAALQSTCVGQLTIVPDSHSMSSDTIFWFPRVQEHPPHTHTHTHAHKHSCTCTHMYAHYKVKEMHNVHNIK